MCAPSVAEPRSYRFITRPGEVTISSDDGDVSDLDDEPAKYAKAWDESKHPRGQPENAGQFAEAPSGGGKAGSNVGVVKARASLAVAEAHAREVAELAEGVAGPAVSKMVARSLKALKEARKELDEATSEAGPSPESKPESESKPEPESIRGSWGALSLSIRP